LQWQTRRERPALWIRAALSRKLVNKPLAFRVKTPGFGGFFGHRPNEGQAWVNP